MAGLNNNVFHVEFGFNETELTSLLEAGSYHDAEKLILQNAHASYLDEGCYERTPLNIVLCGRDNTNEVGAVRNFHIAKCLVQHGASPNYRVPKTDFGYYLSPGETPLELLVHFYNKITAHEACVESLEEADVYRTKHENWNAKLVPVIGINQKYVTSLDDLKEDILALVFIMLSHGGDCNVLNEFRQTLLHRTAAYSTDVRMLECLFENGGDINAVDVYGNTALMYCCRYCQLAPYHLGEINDYDENPLVWVKRTIENCCYNIKKTFIQTLLQSSDIQLDIKNKHGKTALFYCMERGDWQNALLLLQKGCSVAEQGIVSEFNDFYKSTSPLFISMYSSRCMHYFKENYMTESGLHALSQIFHVPLVDQGYFDKKHITAELYTDIEENMKNINSLHIKQLGLQVLHLLFGHTTCTLRQLCSRRIFQCWMKKFSQRVFSLPDSDDSSLSSGNKNSSPLRHASDPLRALSQAGITQKVSINVPADDEVVLLSSFQPLLGNSLVASENSSTSTPEGAYGYSGNDFESSGIQQESDKKENEHGALNVLETLEEEDGEIKQLENETKGLQIETMEMKNETKTVKNKTTELESESEIHATEGDHLLKNEIDYDQMSIPNTETQKVEISTSKENNAISNENQRKNDVSLSTSDSSSDLSVVSCTSETSSIHWPTRFSDLWKHLGRITAAELDKELLTVLYLPKDTLICFELELLRVSLFLSRVTRYHRTCDWQMMDRIYGKGSNEPSSDESVSDEDESGEEYW